MLTTPINESAELTQGALYLIHCSEIGTRYSLQFRISSVMDADPDPHGSTLIWLSWIRICIGNADPDPGARKLTIFTNKPDL
jgi:hypothetical protein